jgi:hypothetical protein
MEGSESEIILACGACGESTVLAGPLEVWRSPSTTFGCRCGERLTLADRLDSGGSQQVPAVADSGPPTSPHYI